MCLPVSFLKCWMFIAGVINLAFGILFIVVGAAFNSSDFDWTDSLKSDNLKSVRGQIFLGLLITGIFIILTGFFAIIGGYKRIKTCIAVYSCTAMIFLCVSAAFLAISIIGTSFIDDNLTSAEKCNEFEYFEDANRYF